MLTCILKTHVKKVKSGNYVSKKVQKVGNYFSH